MSYRAGSRYVPGWLVGAACFLGSISPIHADDTEYREFSVFVDGKEAGSSKMTLIQKDDGSTFMSGSVDVKFRKVIVDYIFKIETKEWWKDGRLIGMQSSSNDNGKKSEVLITADNNQLRLRVNGQDRPLSVDAWTNSYWKLADAKFHNKKLPIVESDTGKDFVGDLKYVDTQQLKVGSQLQDCYHFRVTGGPTPIDLWFDRYYRLVRQEFTEAGHKMIVQLVNVRR